MSVRFVPNTLIIGTLSVFLIGPAFAASTKGKEEQTPVKKPELVGQTLTIQTHDKLPEVKGFNPKACFPLQKIVIRGIERVEVEEVRKKVEPLAYRCLDNTLANAIVMAVNEVHSGAGWVTTQGTLPDQDIRKTKSLTIDVYTGRIGKVVYKEPETDEDLAFGARMSKAWKPVSEAKGLWGFLRGMNNFFDALGAPLDSFQILDGRSFGSLKPWGTFNLQSGEPLHIDRIQQNAELMNRVSSNHTEAKLEAGADPGTSDVVYTNARKDSFRLLIGYETNGAALNNTGSTVDKRLRIDVAKDNLIGINDMWRGTFASGINTNEATASFSVPWRRFLFTIDGSYSENLNDLAQGVQLFERKGIATGTVSYALERTKDVTSNLDGSFRWRRGDRWINDVALIEQTFSILRFGGTRTHLFDTWQFYYGAGISKGLPWFDATKDAAKAAWNMPRAQFWKADGSVGILKGFKDIGTFRIDITGQWTDHPLYADDQLTLGSSTTVRGFTNYAAKVDQGAVVRSEFSFVLPADKILGDNKDNLVLANEILTSMQPYVFADYGFGRQLADKRDIARAGVGGGLRYNHGRLSFDISYARAIYETGTRNYGKSAELYFTASMKLF